MVWGLFRRAPKREPKPFSRAEIAAHKKQDRANDLEERRFYGGVRGGEWTGQTKYGPGYLNIVALQYEVRAPKGDLFWTMARPAQHPVDRYFAAFNPLERAQREGKFDQAFEIAKAGMPGLRQVATEDVLVHGHVRIQSSPLLDALIDHCVFHASTEGPFDELVAFLQTPPEFATWSPMVEEGRARWRTWKAIAAHLQAEPGAAQNTIAKAISAEDAREVTTLVQRAQKRKLIRRQTLGKTYRLFLEDRT